MQLQSKIYWECVEEDFYRARCKVIKGTIEVYDVTHNDRGSFDVNYKKTFTARSIIQPEWITSGYNSLYFLLRSIARNVTDELTDLQYNGNLVNYRSIK